MMNTRTPAPNLTAAGARGNQTTKGCADIGRRGTGAAPARRKERNEGHELRELSLLE